MICNWAGRTRTYNLLIQSQTFCQLNYSPLFSGLNRTYSTMSRLVRVDPSVNLGQSGRRRTADAQLATLTGNEFD